MNKVQELLACARQFYEWRWMWGTAGNLSVKVKDKPLTLRVTPSGLNKGFLKENDLTWVTCDSHRGPAQEQPPINLGRPRKGWTGPTPSSETAIHLAFYQTLPDCQAVFHVHPMYATLLSRLLGHATQQVTFTVPWFEMMKGLGVSEEEAGELPVFPNWQDVTRGAAEIRRYFSSGPRLPVIYIYNHGLTSWGKTLEQARQHLEITEYVSEYLWHLHSTGATPPAPSQTLNRK